jgi:hypothetical protein
MANLPSSVTLLDDLLHFVGFAQQLDSIRQPSGQKLFELSQ